MHAPVLVTPPEILPVSLADAKAHLKVEQDGEDALIAGLIAAATGHLDGWTGVLGRALMTQTWRQDHDAFARMIRLPVGPAASVSSVTWRNPAGQIATVASSEYALRRDALGDYVRFRDSFTLPHDLHESAAVSVTWTAGAEEAPASIKVAILLLVGSWYRNREAVTEGARVELPYAVNVLLAPFRRVSL